jgi:hypothetical protein
MVSAKMSTAFNTTIRAQARAMQSTRLRTFTGAYAVGLEFVEMSRGDARNFNALLRMLQKALSRQ